MIQDAVGLLLRRSSREEDRPALFSAQFALSHACWPFGLPGSLASIGGARSASTPASPVAGRGGGALQQCRRPFSTLVLAAPTDPADFSGTSLDRGRARPTAAGETRRTTAHPRRRCGPTGGVGGVHRHRRDPTTPTSRFPSDRTTIRAGASALPGRNTTLEAAMRRQRVAAPRTLAPGNIGNCRKALPWLY